MRPCLPACSPLPDPSCWHLNGHPPLHHCCPLLASWHQRYKVLRWKRPAAKSTCCSTKEVGDRATGQPAPGAELLHPYLHQQHWCTQAAPSWCTAMVRSPPSWCRTRFGALLPPPGPHTEARSTVTDHQLFFFLRMFARGPKLPTANMSRWWALVMRWLAMFLPTVICREEFHEPRTIAVGDQNFLAVATELAPALPGATSTSGCLPPGR